MKFRFPLAGCCLFAALLIGVRLGQWISTPVDDSQVVERVIVSPLGSDGWQLASGDQSGPSATLRSESTIDDSALAELISQPADSRHAEVEDISNEPDIAYFPEVIVGVAGQLDDQPDGPSATSALDGPEIPSKPPALTDEESAVWQAELKNLPAGQAEEILDLRRQLGSVASESLGLSFPESVSHQGDAPQLFPVLAESEASPIPLPFSTTKESNVTLVSGEDIPPALKRLRLEAVANHKENLANAKTPGFKRRQIILLNISDAAANRPAEKHTQGNSLTAEATDNASDNGKGVQTVAHEAEASKDTEESVEPEPVTWLSRLDLRQGELISTANPLDLAIDGPGWLQVDRNGRPEYIRGGVLGFDENNQLGIRTGGGLLLIDPAVHFPETGRRLFISESGKIYAIDIKEERHAIGHLMAYQFIDASALRRSDIGTYVETKEVGSAMVPDGSSVRFLQSFLEVSNVDRQQELADLNHLQSVIELLIQAKRSEASP